MKCNNKNKGTLAGVVIACKNNNYDEATFGAKVKSGDFMYLPAMDVSDANVAPTTYSRIDGTTVDTSQAKRGVTLTIDADDFLSARFASVESGDYFGWKVYKNAKNELTLQTNADGGMFGLVVSGMTTTEPGLSSAPVQSFTVVFKDFNPICIKYFEIAEIPYVNIVCAYDVNRTAMSVTMKLLSGGIPALDTASGYTASGTTGTTYALSIVSNEAILTITLATGASGTDTITITDGAGIDIFAPFDISWA